MDTLAIVETLTAAGVPEPQAKAHARIITESAEETAAVVSEKAGSRIDTLEKERDNLATKGDIAGLRLANKNDITELRLANKSDIAELRADLVKWIVIVNGITAGLLIAAAAVIFGN